MMEWIIYLALVMFGSVLGSFAGASVWRLRARQLSADKKAGEKIDNKEFNKLKKLLGKSIKSDRSQCLHCSYELKWYDLVPLISWITLRGKCRSCHKPIGKFELAMELGVAAFFIASYLLWPFELTSALNVTQFVAWLLTGVAMAILFAYDLKWFLLPDSISLVFAILAAIFTSINIIQSPDIFGSVVGVVGSVAVMSGLYLFIYILSKGAWIGFGDVKLGVGLGILIGDWKLSLLALFLANLIGTLVVIPLLASKKIGRTAHIPFGPFLIAGALLAIFIGAPIIDWYMSLLGI